MVIFKTAMAVGDTTYTVTHVPMSYRDWLFYHPAGKRYDKQVVRYIFEQYCQRIERTTNTETIVIGYDDLFTELKAQHAATIIDRFFVKSSFGSDDLIEQTIDANSELLCTMDGLYDLFLFLHLPYDVYLQMLSSDFDTRMYIVSLLQTKTGIIVKDRLKDHNDTGLPLDLINDRTKYEELVTTQGYKRAAPGAQAVPPKQPNGEHSIFDKATKALQHAIRQQPAVRNKTFDWRADERDFCSSEQTQDQTLMNQTRG